MFIYPLPTKRQFYDHSNPCLDNENSCSDTESSFKDDAIDRPWLYWIKEELPYPSPKDLGHADDNT